MPKENLECIFCDINEKDLVLTTEEGIVLAKNPVCAGHVLVGGHEHGAGLANVSEDTAGAVMRLANRVAKTIVSATNAEKVYVAAVGDKDKHFHVHLIPKFAGDPNLGPHIFGPDGWGASISGSADADNFERVVKTIRGDLKLEVLSLSDNQEASPVKSHGG